MHAYKKHALTGVALLFVFSIVSFPAKTAFSWFAPAGVEAFGLEGTVWSGNARIITANGLQLRNTEWDLAPAWLFTGKLAATLKTRWNGGFMEGFAYAGLGQTLGARDSIISADIALLTKILGLPSASGQFTAELNALDIRSGWPERLVGAGVLRQLGSPLLGQNDMVIGDLGIVFDTTTETEANTITGTLEDRGGQIELRGRLLLTPPGNYELKARIKARDNALPALRRNLGYLGSPEPDGTRLFQLAGSI